MDSTSGKRGDVWVGAGPFRYRVDPQWTIPADRSTGEIVGVACDAEDRRCNPGAISSSKKGGAYATRAFSRSTSIQQR